MKHAWLYKITRPVISVLFKICYRPTYIGLNNIPTQGPFVLAGNHTNYFDCLLLMSSTRQVIHFLAKEELIKGLKGIIFKNMGIISVNRKIHDKTALNNSIKALKENKVIGIFPEGTINRTEDLIMPFKIGAVKMSKDAKCKIVPFIIKGKYKLFRKSITITFLTPYKIEKDLDVENKKLMDIIKIELGKGDNI